MTQTESKTAETATAFQPRIVAYVCNWCTYAGADLAGTSRLRYPPNVRIIKLPCTGRIDPLFILKAFEGGADAVLVSGCHPGDCHYQEGNYKARRRIAILEETLKAMGFEGDRVMLRWISASEGGLFAETIRDFTEKVRAKGPAPTKQLWAL